MAAGRIANLPTVFTNVLVGAVLATVARLGHAEFAAPIFGGRFCIALAAGICLYIAGCFYNDYADRHWDAAHKPDRALPAGRIPAGLLLTFILILAAFGTGLSTLLGGAGVGVAVWILAFIWVYTWSHKRTPLAIVPMGFCRGGLYLLGAVSVLPSAGMTSLPGLLLIVAVPALGLVAYIAGITLVARSEATNTLPPAAKWIGLTLLMAPALTHGIGTPRTPLMLVLLLAVIIVGMLAAQRRVERSVGGFVSLALAGICIVDGLLLLRVAPIIGMSTWIALVIAIVGFLSARLLQRYAPAT